MADFEIDERVDITDGVCPMTFVKAKVAMEEIEVGQILAVTMNDGEPVQNVPRSFKEEGQQILKLINNENGTHDLIVKKVEEEKARRSFMAKRVDAATFETEVLSSDVPVIVEFYSDSCIPCKQMSPILGGLEDDYEEQIKIVKVNVNFDDALAASYEVAASPTLLFFKDGAEVNRLRGLQKRPAIEEVIKTIIA